jgi:cytochrome c'
MNVPIPRSAMLLAFFTIMGCSGGEGAGSKEKPSAPVPTAQPATPAKEPHAALAMLDTRKPVPLVPMMANHQKQNMRDHLVAVQEIVASVAAGDFAAVEKAAGRIGYSEQMGAMCTHMGAGASGFTEAALQFHHTADSIAEAAKQKDPQGVLTALSATLSTCTSCHSTFKQDVVDDATWASMTKESAPSGAMHP